jgi:hypothetical protein
MSNGINSPYGLAVVQSQIGNGGTQKLGQYYIYASDDGLTTQPNSIFKGDPVKFVSAPGLAIMAGTIAPEKLSAVTNGTQVQAVATTDADAFVGVFMGCAFIDAASGIEVNSDYWPASRQVRAGTKIIAFVNDDPMAVFSVQVSSSIANATGIIFLSTGIALNANLSVAGITFTDPTAIAGGQNPRSGSSVYGSAYYLDVSSISATTATLDMKIIGINPVINTNPNPTGLIPGKNMPFINLLVKFNKHIYGSVGVAGPTAGA